MNGANFCDTFFYFFIFKPFALLPLPSRMWRSALPFFCMNPLLVVGTVAFDNIETPHGKADHIVGGAATFIAFSAAKFGIGVNLVSVIGDDFPTADLDAMRAAGINLDGLQIKAGEKSFSWTGRYHNDMNSRDTLATDLNVLAAFEPHLPASYRTTPYVMLGNLTPTVQASVLDQMTTRPKLVAIDTMNFWMDIALDDLKAVLRRVDLLTINDEEARQLSGEYSIRRAARKIQAMGPRYLVIKRGEHGALLFHDNSIFFCPAMPLEEVFDPTGAGDSFAGGFMGHLAHTDDLSFENMKRAVVYGSCIASFSVETFGTDRIRSVSAADIEARMNEFRGMMSLA